MAKSNDGPSYLDVLSNELVMNIFHMLTGGPDWHILRNVDLWRMRWSEGGRRRIKRPKGI